MMPTDMPERTLFDTPKKSADEDIEFRTIDVEFDADDDGDIKGMGKAVVSRIGVVDSYGDVIEAGAFGRTATVPMLPNHSWSGEGPPIGLMTVRETKDEENVIGTFKMNPDLDNAQQWMKHLKFAKKQEFSIGFRIQKSRWLTAEEMEERDDGADRVIEKLRLLEVSMVVAGAMPKTRLVELRSARREREMGEVEPEPVEDTPEPEVKGIEIPEFDTLISGWTADRLHSLSKEVIIDD